MMQEHGIYARGKRKFVVTTGCKHDIPVATNLLMRNFTAATPIRFAGVTSPHRRNKPRQ